MTTLVIGATGSVGKDVLAGLAAKGVAARGLSRYKAKLDKFPAGTEGCAGDLTVPGSLGKAFEGVKRMFLLTPLDKNEIQIGTNAITAAKASGVEYIVHMSVPLPEGADKVPHFRNKTLIEQRLQESGIPHTTLRPNNFFQNDLWVHAAIMAYNTYPQPLGNTGLNRVDSRDVADAAINALTCDDFIGQDIALHGPDALTGDGIASIFTQHLSRSIRYAGDDLDAWAKQAQHMMPNWMVSDFKLMYQFFQQHGLLATAEEIQAQQAIVGHPPRRYDDFVSEVIKSWE